MTAASPWGKGNDAGRGGDAPASALHVRVPASSANLGPGYDVLAVALDLALEVTAVPFDGRRIVPAGEGCDEVACGDDNLIWRALVAFCEAHGAAVPDLTLHCDNPIPLERGLGSSSAAAVAGLALARRVTGVPASDHDLIALATDLEGHPDNAAAAVLGGVVVAGDGPARRFEPSRSLRPIACVPSHRASTAAARGLVPSQVSLQTLVGSVRRTALVLAGLTGLAAWDPTVMRDDMHEPPRLEAMAESGRVVDAARAQAMAACLSGAGPTVLVIAAADDPTVDHRLRDIVGSGWRVVPLQWDRAGARVEERIATHP